MEFNARKLTAKDYHELSEAISRAAPKIRFWYKLPNSWHFAVNQNAIAEQAGATSDYDKLHDEYCFMTQDKYNTRRIHLSVLENRSKLGKLLGLRDIEICVYNPKNPLSNVNVRRKNAQLVQIDGLGLGNTYDAQIDFEKGIAFLNEDDQDIAHRLGLMYTPTGIMEVDSLTCSDIDMHKSKEKTDGSGKHVLYCDNRACQKRIRNPVLVVDAQTGGLYHSETCFEKDMGVKAYLAQDIRDLEIKLVPMKISLEDALNMYETGDLQQSLNPKFTKNFRSLNQSEAAVLFIP